MSTLAQQRCFHHALREAVARCPECRHFYCRECIAEHEERVICATCLKRIASAADKPRRSFAGMARAAFALTGIVAAWFVFYFLGQALISIPSSFHEATVWKDRIWPTQ